MDLRTKRVVALTAILFVIAVALQLNGSSVGIWRALLHDDESPPGVLVSSPKNIRSDEWLAWTPSVLSQAFHKPAFPVENPNVGAGKSPLLMNLPVRHFSMFFRPQLYGFFLFNVETAYAFYWNAKIFGLILSFFLLLRTLTGNNFWISLFGTGWVFFSAYIQWWFSCPPMLPEMLASWAAVILCIIQLFRSERGIVIRVIISLVLLIAGANFALCCYPPFQIPLIYLGLAIIAGWFWQNGHAGLHWRAGLISVALTALALGTVIGLYIWECKPTLEIVARTVYPGLRRTHGGELTMKETFNGVFGFFNSSEHDYLTTAGNSCGASNFYPLWLLGIAASGIWLLRERATRRLEILILVCLTILTVYTFCPFPKWFCDLTFLSYTTEARVVMTVGIAGILFSTLLFACPLPSLKQSWRLAIAATAIAVIVLMLVATRPGNEKFLTDGRCGLLLGLNALFIGLFLFAPPKYFCPIFLLCLVLNNGMINPIGSGLGPLLDASPGRVVRQLVEKDPEAKWLVYYSESLPQLIKAQGANVLFAGLSLVPDLVFCRELDASRQFDSIYNRYAFVVFLPAQSAGTREFRMGGPPVYTLKISPLDPALLARGASCVVFHREVGVPETTGMVPIASLPKNGIWIYKLVPVPK